MKSLFDKGSIKMEFKNQQIEINMEELAILYIEKNYSMELLAKLYMMPMPVMSRLLWKHDLLTYKEQYFLREKGSGVSCEVKYLTESRGSRDERSEIEKFQASHATNVEDEFFS